MHFCSEQAPKLRVTCICICITGVVRIFRVYNVHKAIAGTVSHISCPESVDEMDMKDYTRLRTAEPGRNYKVAGRRY